MSKLPAKTIENMVNRAKKEHSDLAVEVIRGKFQAKFNL
jgi:uncharacterized surface protein with fasciclin (FAS1) repeats